jgi:hypothetical protein
MVKKIYRYIIGGLFVAVLSCPIISYTNGFAFWDMFGVPWVGLYGTEQKQEDSLLLTIKKAINYVLALLSFVCLCLVIYAGFLMLASGWDSKKYDTWINIIKNAAIWLAIIGLSWLIVSLIFYVIQWSIGTNIKTN